MKPRAALLLALLVVAAVAVRIPGLLTGLWRDEGSTYFDATASTLGATLREIRLAEINPPGYFLFMRAWLEVVGVSDITMKLPSLLFGVAIVPATYVLGRTVASGATAFAAAVFAAFSTTAIDLSTDARPYACAALLAALATVAAFRILRAPSDAPILRPWIGYVFAVVALTYVQYTGPLLACGLFVGAIVARYGCRLPIRISSFALANVAVALASVPALIGIGGSKSVAASWLEPIGRGQILGRLLEQIGFVVPFDFMRTQYVLALLVAFIAVIALRRANAFVVTGGIGVLVALAIETAALLREPRYAFVFTPLANVLIAGALVSLGIRARDAFDGTDGREVRRFAAPALGAIVTLTFLVGLPAQSRGFVRTVVRPERSGMRALVASSSPDFGPRTLVVVVPDYLGPSLGYYLRDRPDAFLMGVPHAGHPEHFRCCENAWRDRTFVDDTERAIVTRAADYERVALVSDPLAVDRGRVPFSKTLELRARLLRDFALLSDRRYDGNLESAEFVVFATPRLHSRPRRSST